MINTFESKPPEPTPSSEQNEGIDLEKFTNAIETTSKLLNNKEARGMMVWNMMLAEQIEQLKQMLCK